MEPSTSWFSSPNAGGLCRLEWSQQMPWPPIHEETEASTGDLPQLPATRAKSLVESRLHSSSLTVSSHAALFCISSSHFPSCLMHLLIFHVSLKHNFFQGQGEVVGASLTPTPVTNSSSFLHFFIIPCVCHLFLQLLSFPIDCRLPGARVGPVHLLQTQFLAASL